MSDERIRVLIVDDVPQVSQGLVTMLNLASGILEPKIEVVGEAPNGEIAIQKALSLHPDVILLDLEMPIMNGFIATQSIKSMDPSIFIIILTMHEDLANRQKAAHVGADAFVEKSAPPDDLIRAIRDFRLKNYNKELK